MSREHIYDQLRDHLMILVRELRVIEVFHRFDYDQLFQRVVVGGSTDLLQ